MGVPTSEVGYTSAMPRREEHEVHKGMWGHWGGGGWSSQILGVYNSPIAGAVLLTDSLRFKSYVSEYSISIALHVE